MAETKNEYLDTFDELDKLTTQGKAILSVFGARDTVHEMSSEIISNGLWAVADILENINTKHEFLLEQFSENSAASPD